MASDDPFLPLAFSLYSSVGAYAVLAGAGTSKGANVPSAWDIVVDLVSQIAKAQDASDELAAKGADAWYLERYGRKPDYSDVVARLGLTKVERQALLKRYFEPPVGETSKEKDPSEAHRAIARLMVAGVIRVVVTMNLDRLFERALSEVGIEATIVSTDADAAGLPPLHTVRACIVHLHGDYLEPESMLNTSAELSKYSPDMAKLLTQILTDYGLIVVGWSATYDKALRNAVRRYYGARYTMGWIEPQPLNRVARRLVRDKSALVLAATADEAFKHLSDQVVALTDRQARDPLTLDVAVSRIKRELEHRNPAITAHDTVVAEFSRLRSLSAFHLSNYNDTSQLRSLNDQVFEAVRVPLGGVAVLSFWGPQDTDAWWMPEIERLARPARLGGAGALINLPVVAASMLFYAAGVAAVANEKYERVAKLFALRGSRPGAGPSSVVTVLDPVVLGYHAAAHYDHVAAVLREALTLGTEPIEDAWQAFEVLRMVAVLRSAPNFNAIVSNYAAAQRSEQATASLQSGGAVASTTKALREQLTALCSADGHHVLGAERMHEQSGLRWASPPAERLYHDIDREIDTHLLVRAMNIDKPALLLALTALSTNIGETARVAAQRSISGGGVEPTEVWLDARRPTPRGDGG